MRFLIVLACVLLVLPVAPAAGASSPSAPGLGLAVTADPPEGTAPLSVTFHFALTNLSAPAEPLDTVSVAHPGCTPAYESGDADANGQLDAGETWRYGCTRSFAAAGEYTLTSRAAALTVADGTAVESDAVDTLVRVLPPPAAGRLELTAVAEPARGSVPLTVTYTYTVRNVGTGAVRDVTVTAAGCAPATTAAGDLAAGATRTFTCTRVFGAVGTFGSGAIASGVDVLTGQTVTSDEVTTEVTADSAPEPSTQPGPGPGATESPEPDDEPVPAPPATRSRRVSFTASGRFARPCRGRVTLTLKAGGKTIAKRTVRPDRRCRYRAKFTVARSKLGKATRVTVSARLGKRTKSQRFSVPR